MFSNSDSVTFVGSPSKTATEVSNSSAIRINVSESGTDNPFSHFEIVCLTTFNFIARSSCDKPLSFRRFLILSLSIPFSPYTLIFIWDILYGERPLHQATDINIALVWVNERCFFFFADKNLCVSRLKKTGRQFRYKNWHPVLVDDIGLEPMTLRTSSECSSQLS